MKTVKSSQARAKFQDIVDSVHYTKKPIMISKNGKPWVVIQALSDKIVSKKKGKEEKL
jgi:prevent-host-death family protein